MAEVVLLDGGVGQEMLARSGDPATPLWSTRVMIDHPGLAGAVHRAYFEAGATVATANTYALHRDRLAPAGLEGRLAALHDQAWSEAAAAAAGRGRVAVSLGPLVASYRPETLPPPAEARAAYAEIVGLHAGRAGLFLAETVASVAHAEAVLAALRDAAPGAEVWLAVTVDDEDGTRLRSGEPVAALGGPVSRHRPDRVLANCAAPEAIGQALAPLAALGPPFGGYANGFARITKAFLRDGATVDVLPARPELTPDRYAACALGWVAAGATLVGGCCNIGPAHIARLAEALRAAGHRIV